MAHDFPDFTAGVVKQATGSLTSVAHDFPDWTDGVVTVSQPTPPGADLPDWTKAVWEVTNPTPGPAAGFVSRSGGGLASGAGTVLGISPPSSEAAGNLVVAYIVSAFPTETITGPPGWTLAGSHATASLQVGVWTKALTGADTGNYDWTGTSSGLKSGFINQYAGVNTLDGYPLFADNGAAPSTAMAAPGVTPTVTTDTWLAMFAWSPYNASYTTPAGMTARGFTGAFGTAPVGASFDETLASTATTGPAVSDLNMAGQWISCSVLIGPA